MNKDVKIYRSYMEASGDYCEKHFEVAIRMTKLWRGVMPDVLDLTFSKLMINYAHAAVQDRIPKQLANLFSSREPCEVRANDPQSEFHKEEAQNWLNDFFMSPNKLNIQRSIVPTLQAANITGTAYRMPCIRHRKVKDKWEEIITSRDIDLYQIFPCPTGGEINPLDRWGDDAMPWFIFIDWMTDDQIKAFSMYDGFKADAVRKMTDDGFTTTESELDAGLYEKYTVLAGIDYGQESTEYRKKLNNIDGTTKKRRVAHVFSRDKWQIIAQDKYLFYDGPNPLGDGLLPLVKYVITPDLKDHFGIGAIEMLEDLYVAAALNVNYRFDYLSKAMFPAKWIRDDVMGNHPESEFYDRPYAIHRFPMHAKIAEAVFVDRMPEITQQTFLEDDRLSNMTQEIGGLPNYQRGMSGSAPSNDSASGINTLVQMASGRLGMESMCLEFEGLAQEARLILALGQKYIGEPVPVNVKSEDGWDWTTIDPIAFEGKYTVVTHGTRYLEQREQWFQKILAMMPSWVSDQQIDQIKLKKQIFKKMDVFDNPDDLLLPPVTPVGPGMAGPAPAVSPGTPGGLASSQDITNGPRSIANRNAPEPISGNMVPVSGGY
jgi:hypothetical protein